MNNSADKSFSQRLTAVRARRLVEEAHVRRACLEGAVRVVEGLTQIRGHDVGDLHVRGLPAVRIDTAVQPVDAAVRAVGGRDVAFGNNFRH